jgi:hypothetical protein
MWATLTEAASYLGETIGGEAWASLTSDQQSRYLTTAFRQLSNDPNYCFPDDTETYMASANIELAFWLASNPDAQKAVDLANSGVESFRIGQFAMAFRGDDQISVGRASYPAVVINLLDRYRCDIPAAAKFIRTNG